MVIKAKREWYKRLPSASDNVAFEKYKKDEKEEKRSSVRSLIKH